MHYHCDDVGDLSNDYIDNRSDKKIDVNVDFNVANFWRFADAALVKDTQELQQAPEEQEFEQKPEEQEPEEQEPEEKELEEHNETQHVKLSDWDRLQRRAWTRVQISPKKFQYTHPEVAQITTSMKKAFKIDMNRGVSRSKRATRVNRVKRVTL